MSFSIPVLFIVFNRPETTRRVFEVIQQAKPSRLYIAADGPRENKSGEDVKVQAVRDFVMNHINWECEVKTFFREKNLGCRKAVSSAIDWFFEHEEEGIILEDDCLPDASFFPFCAELLEKYRYDNRVMMISGDNFQADKKALPGSYYFSKYCHIWGWASWRRAWKHYDVSMSRWPQSYAKGFLKTLDPSERLYWKWCFKHVFSGRLETWDYQWVFACWMHKGLAAMPAVNLVSNIGFGSEGTHTQQGDYRTALQMEKLSFPLSHPSEIVANDQADRRIREASYRMSVLQYAWGMLKEKVGL